MGFRKVEKFRSSDHVDQRHAASVLSKRVNDHQDIDYGARTYQKQRQHRTRNGFSLHSL